MFILKIVLMIYIQFISICCSKTRETSLDKREDLKFIFKHIENLNIQQNSEKTLSENSKKSYINLYGDKNIEILSKVYTTAFENEIKKYDISRACLKSVYLITDEKLLKLFVASESLHMQKRHLLNIKRIYELYFPKGFKKQHFYFKFVNESTKEETEIFLNQILNEYFDRENIFKLDSQINVNHSVHTLFANHLSNLDTICKKVLDTKIETYYQAFRKFLKKIELASSPIHLDHLFFLINFNIFESQDYFYLTTFCEEFSILQKYNNSIWIYSTEKKTVHYLVTQSILDMRCIIILLFSNIRSLFTTRYVPLYKIEIIYNLKTRLLISLCLLRKNVKDSIHGLKEFYEKVENVLKVHFMGVNNLKQVTNIENIDFSK
ncbi:hypothetical protein TUBRATIS_31060 [Tubulinosema ratisbonensis]|uniref:Lipoprotein n=1 Tax=Tubulinosema ratisbonensis TaxID=291195 RepID=A0A437AH23_9MICR|nr:hypothetical protein TUBRATIS_31060 [Tubulinosema ratisbonensis]